MSFNLAGLGIGLREGVLLLIAVVAIYMAFVLWRMRRVVPPPVVPKASGGAAVSPASDPLASSVAPRGAGLPEPEDQAWGRASRGMAEDLLRQGLEQEVAQLRDEVDALRSEVAALRGDLQQELTHLRASQTVSPIYGDAMQLAAAGYDPATIAERCGIARAEADLVVALARSQER